MHTLHANKSQPACTCAHSNHVTGLIILFDAHLFVSCAVTRVIRIRKMNSYVLDETAENSETCSHTG